MSITFNETSSDDFGMLMQNELVFKTIERDMETVKVPGRDGVILLDNDRDEPLDFPLVFLMKKTIHFDTIEEQIHAVRGWLSGKTGYHYLTWIGEPKHSYRARINGATTVRRRNSRLAYVDAPFEFHPRKFLTTGLVEKTITNNSILTGQGSLNALPIIRITGTGNVTLTINGKNLVLQNVTGGVIVDCELETVTNLTGTASMMQHLYSYPFPFLVPGDNYISWTNPSQFSVAMIPRWGDKA